MMMNLLGILAVEPLAEPLVVEPLVVPCKDAPLLVEPLGVSWKDALFLLIC